MQVVTKSALETQKFGEKLARRLKGGEVVCLYGELGAGKTTLVQGVAKGLGIEGRIISPTFVLTRRYKIQDTRYKQTRYLWHVDLYRLNSVEEAKTIGIEELMEDKNNIVVIEWAEKIESLLPDKRWEIRLKIEEENKRGIFYEALH